MLAKEFYIRWIYGRYSKRNLAEDETSRVYRRFAAFRCVLTCATIIATRKYKILNPPLEKKYPLPAWNYKQEQHLFERIIYSLEPETLFLS